MIQLVFKWIIIVQSEEGEQLSLRDMKGTVLVTPPLPLAANRSSPIPSHRDSDYKEGFTVKMTQLQNLLQILY